MKKTYEPDKIEQHHYQAWEDAKYFEPSKNGEKEPYCIILPPPNITGTLHMGHAFQDTVTDCLIRYHRMCGDATLWQPGVDHAGIATQMVVERQLEAQNQSRKELGREKFINEIWKWKKHSADTINNQLRRLGASLDWSRECFTLDPEISDVVTQVFIDLYNKKLIYRGKRLVNWDPALKTAVSDLEVLTQEENGHLWHIRYPTKDTTTSIVVATTRPETMLGDVAVAVHPEDDRYQHLIGKTVIVPLAEREIPIIADDYVDPEFGSGCVKITPAHDFNDYAVGQKHQLPLINIMHLDASLNDTVPAAYRGLDRYVARKKILQDLEASNLLEKTEPRRIMIPRGDRSGAIVEPLLTDQWFVRVEPLAKKARLAVYDGRIKFIPENWSKTYFEWMNRIQDWCISRQLWWGHRIPAWYDAQGNCYVGKCEAQIREQHQLDSSLTLTQDEDVLDTWFSSALWPLSTLGWSPQQKPEQQTPEFKRFYPTSVLVTGFDIIFFWVARMIMLGLECTDKVPFHQVYVHGLVLDAEGKKMSKSKGNVLDPIDLIDGISLDALLEKRLGMMMQTHMRERVEKKTRQQFPGGIPAYGTDALRFTFMAMASNNRDIRFELKRIEGYRNFCNKLWNATRYVLMNCNKGNPIQAAELPLDVWIEKRIEELAEEIHNHFSNYRFDLAANAMYEFVWHDYCDSYLEFCKVIQTSPTSDFSQEKKEMNQGCQIRTIEAILRLLHPVIPFITEELWQQVKSSPIAYPEDNSISIQQRPYLTKGEFPRTIIIRDYNLTNRNTVGGEMLKVLADIDWFRELVTHIRRIRAEMNISPATKIPLLLQFFTEQNKACFTRYEKFITQLAKLNDVQWLNKDDTAPPAAIAVIGNMHLLIPTAGLIDIAAEIKRLEKEIAKTKKDLESTHKRLNDPNFSAKAAVEVVAQTRQQADTLATRQTVLERQLDNLTQ